MLDKHISEKLRILSFVCAMLVVVQHSFAHATFVESFVTESVTRMAVPFFFMVSGLLLYRDSDFSFRWLRDKVLSRCKTLLVPYFAWAAASILLTCSWGNVASAKGFLESFGIVNAAPLSAGHLWYIRILFLFVVFSVPIAIALKYIRWVVPVSAMFVNVVFLRSSIWSSLCWFSMGAMIALYHTDALARKLSLRILLTLSASALALAVFRTLAFRGGVCVAYLPVFTRATETLLVALLILVAWCGCDYVAQYRIIRSLLFFSPASFFMYCAHVYVYRLFPGDWYWLFRIVLTIVSCVGLYCLVRRYCPKALVVLTGGR